VCVCRACGHLIINIAVCSLKTHLRLLFNTRIHIKYRRAVASKFNPPTTKNSLRYEIFVLVAYDTASLGNRFATFRDNGAVSKMRPLRCLKTSRTDYTAARHHIPHEYRPQLHHCENRKIHNLNYT